MTLDARGIISAIQIAFYVPILCLSLFLVLRHGFRREAGWIFLFSFSIVRIVGAALLIAAESAQHASISLFVTAYILESAGLSPLLLATSSFLAIVGLHMLSDFPLPAPRIFHLIRILLLVAVILAIVGGTKAAKPSTASSGITLRRVGAILFVVLYAVIAAMHALFWVRKDQIRRNNRTLLIGISAALPFLAVRIVYSALSAFSPNTLLSSSTPPPPNSLSKFNSITGRWQLYLVLSVLMEFVVITIYCTVGTMLPLQQEHDAAATERKSEDTEEHGLYAPPA